MSATRIDKELEGYKKDKNIQKFMKKYRYQYYVTMLLDLAELVRNAYLEGYHNGLGQHSIDEIISAQHQLLDELMGQKNDYLIASWDTLPDRTIKDYAYKSVEAVPLSAIEALKEGLK